MFSWIFTLTSTFIISCFEFIDLHSNYKKITVADNDDDGDDDDDDDDGKLFFGMVDGRKAFSLISSQNHCQRSSPSHISDTSQAGFKPAQKLSLGFVE